MSNTKSQLVYKTEKSSPIQKYSRMHGLKLFYVLWKIRMQNEKCTLNKFIMVKHCKSKFSASSNSDIPFHKYFFYYRKIVESKK